MIEKVKIGFLVVLKDVGYLEEDGIMELIYCNV